MSIKFSQIKFSQKEKWLLSLVYVNPCTLFRPNRSHSSGANSCIFIAMTSIQKTCQFFLRFQNAIHCQYQWYLIYFSISQLYQVVGPCSGFVGWFQVVNESFEYGWQVFKLIFGAWMVIICCLIQEKSQKSRSSDIYGVSHFKVTKFKHPPNCIQDIRF